MIPGEGSGVKHGLTEEVGICKAARSCERHRIPLAAVLSRKAPMKGHYGLDVAVAVGVSAGRLAEKSKC
jgi:hypothetical protein